MNSRLARQHALLIISAASSLCLVGWLLWLCRFGIDFTDESFSLVWMANPFLYKASSTQFGFVYHPLYELVDGRVALLRQANVLITVGLAWAMAQVFLERVFPATQRGPRLVISGGLALSVASVWVFSGMWLSIPGYNTLTLQGLMLGATGLMLTGAASVRAGVAGWFLLGLGGWLTFMGKPSSAAVLAVLVLLHASDWRHTRWRGLVGSALLALLLLAASALAIDGSIGGFVARLQDGVASTVLLTGRAAPALLRWDDFSLGTRGGSLLLLLALALHLVAMAQLRAAPSSRTWKAWLPLAPALLALAVAAGWNSWLPHLGAFQGLLYLSVPLAAALVWIRSLRHANDNEGAPKPWRLGLVLLALPYAYAFGSGNNYWVMAGSAGVFWVLTGLLLLRPLAAQARFDDILLTFGMFAQLIAVLLVTAGISTPYRQPRPLLADDHAVEFGTPGSVLVVDRDFGQYLVTAVGATRAAGFARGNPMIDLSGRFPGLLYAFGATSIGQPWTLGGYPGSEAALALSLRRVPCAELARAWLLVEPEGPGGISLHVLASFGADARDFERVAQFRTAPGASGYSAQVVQEVWKPIRSSDAALRSCMARRAAPA